MSEVEGSPRSPLSLVRDAVTVHAVPQVRSRARELHGGFVDLCDRRWLPMHGLAWAVTAVVLVLLLRATHVVPVDPWVSVVAFGSAATAVVLFFVNRATGHHGVRPGSMAALSALWFILWMVYGVAALVGSGTSFARAGELVFWMTWDAFPLDVPATLGWEQPVTGYEFDVGLALVIVRAFVIFGVLRFLLSIVEHDVDKKQHGPAPAHTSSNGGASTGAGPSGAAEEPVPRRRTPWWVWPAVVALAVAFGGGAVFGDTVETKDRGALRAGDCLDLTEPEAPEAALGQVGVLDCDEPHTGEVVETGAWPVLVLDDAPRDPVEYPGEAELARRATASCRQQDLSVEGGYRVDVVAVYPTAAAWYQFDDRALACLAYVTSGYAGSAEGSQEWAPVPVTGSLADDTVAVVDTPTDG